MIRKYILSLFVAASLSLTAQADDHTHFLGLSLSLTPSEMMEELSRKGLQQEDSLSLSGRISGLDVWLKLNAGRDSAGLNSMLLTTQYQQGRTQRDDYSALMRWMRHHYGAPTWESFVRGHAFARWYVGFDRDIVMIATAKPSVEVWFYDNHAKRNIDYYSILKYCERNPSDDVPNYTAREQVTWRSTSVPLVTKKTAKGRHKTVRKSVKSRRKAVRTTHRKTRRRR